VNFPPVEQTCQSKARSLADSLLLVPPPLMFSLFAFIDSYSTWVTQNPEDETEREGGREEGEEYETIDSFLLMILLLSLSHTNSSFCVLLLERKLLALVFYWIPFFGGRDKH
jgi:hypothetical protein